MRKDVWKLPAGDTTLEWYGKAVLELKKRPISDPTSWWSLAAMHGIDQQLWIDLGYLDAEEALPFDPTVEGFWNQCQHQSWYFLPWHRGYLAAFEAILLDVIVKLGGPPDWALPYWNYDGDHPATLKFPTAFANEKLPDGSPNGLWVRERYGRNGDGNIIITKSNVSLTRLWTATEFFDEANVVPTSFGGSRTGFNHGQGRGSGQLESAPHGPIHVLVGGTKAGGDPDVLSNNGLMAMFETAGLDPIFWLHHANIDRLWEVWLTIRATAGAAGHPYQNPTDTGFLNQPAGKFIMPRPNGSTFTFTPAQVLDTTDPALDYIYQEVKAPPRTVTALSARLERLGVPRAETDLLSGVLSMAPHKRTELVGANDTAIQLGGGTVDTHVSLDAAASNRFAAKLSLDTLTGPNATSPPDRIYLALENITSTTDSAVFQVYVDLPADKDPDNHPEKLAGVVSMFGARQASAPNGPHGGNGLTETLDITDIVDALHITGTLDAGRLNIRIVPQMPLSDKSRITVGRIRVYRQGD
jgi:tyrosinase